MRSQQWVDELAYGVPMAGFVDERHVARRADELIQQRIYNTPVAEYFDAIDSMLRSDDLLSRDSAHEEIVRDFLERLRAALDARRPWPAGPFTQLSGMAEWAKFQHAEVIAQINFSEMDTGARLNRGFDEVPGVGRVLVLKLRSGETVALRATAGYTEPGVALLADTEDPARTLAAFRELAGFTEDEVVPV